MAPKAAGTRKAAETQHQLTWGSGGEIVTLEALKTQIEKAVGDLATRMEHSGQETNRMCQRQLDSLQTVVAGHQHAASQAAQDADEALHKAGHIHADALGEVSSLHQRLAAGLQASTKSVTANVQAVAASIARSVEQLSGQYGLGTGSGAEAGSAAPKAGTASGKRAGGTR